MTGRHSVSGKASAIFCGGLVAVVFLAVTLAGSPAAARYASVVVNADTGKILQSLNADTRNYPASLTKIMTLYMVFEGLREGKLTMTQALPVSRRATGMAPSKLGLKVNETITTRDAILALITKSANDAAVVIAEALGGTEIKFAQDMTKRARELGMIRTTFKNASGLPNRRQLSTARDMAVLALRLLKDFPEEYRYFATKKFKYRGHTYSNHNGLLDRYDGADGIKTGYIRASGFNLVASAERDGTRVIGVMFGGQSAGSRDAQMVRLLDRGFAKVSPRKNTVASAARAPVAPRPKVTPYKAAEPGQLDKWGVQVGAFRSLGSARTMASAAATRLSSIAPGAEISISPLRSQGIELHRARLIGMSEAIAREACRRLNRMKVACVPVSPITGVILAFNR